MCGSRLNLATLYREVCLRGGYDAVGEAKWWKRVGAALLGGAAAQRATALGTVLKYAYEKWLKSFAAAHFVPAKHAALIEETRVATASARALGRLNQPVRRRSGAGARTSGDGGTPSRGGSRPPSAVGGAGRLASLALPPVTGAGAGAGGARGGGLLTGAARAAAERAAGEMIAALAPRPGPALVLDAGFEARHLGDAGRALLVGAPPRSVGWGGGRDGTPPPDVAWALNSVGVAAAAASPPLDLSTAPPALAAGLLRVIGWAAAPAAARGAESEPPIAGRSTPVPPQPWWSDAVLAGPATATAAVTAAAAAAAALRAAVLTCQGSATRAAAPDALATTSSVLRAALDTRAPGVQETAASLLDMLVVCGGGVDVARGGGDGLVAALLDTTAPPTPLRLRVASLRALTRLATAPVPAATQAAVVAVAPALAAAAAAVLATPPADARAALRAETDGELGPPEVAPRDASGAALRAAAATLAAECAVVGAAALQVLAGPSAPPSARAAVAACPPALRALVAVVAARLPELPGRGGSGLVAALGAEGATHASRCASAATEAAAAALAGLAADPTTRATVTPHAGVLASRLAGLAANRTRAAEALAAALVACEGV